MLFRAGDARDLARAIIACISRPGERELKRRQCIEVVQRFYNPQFQRRVIDRAISGNPADDLFWQKETAADVHATKSGSLD